MSSQYVEPIKGRRGQFTLICAVCGKLGGLPKREPHGFVCDTCVDAARHAAAMKHAEPTANG